MFTFWLLLLCSPCFAETFGEKAITADELSLEDENSVEKQDFIVSKVLLGYGGFFSSGSQNGIMLLSAQFGYIFKNRFRLGLDYHAKLHPERNSRSFFQTIGPSFTVDIWRGIFVSAHAGLAFAYVENKGYQQSKNGPGWGLAAGYSYMFHENIGFVVQADVNQRYLKQLYTSAGLLLGMEMRF